MYAVIRVGTSQERVTEGQVVRVDLRSEEIGAKVQFEPVLLVDGDKVTAGPACKDLWLPARFWARRRAQDSRPDLQVQGQSAQALGPSPALLNRGNYKISVKA